MDNFMIDCQFRITPDNLGDITLDCDVSADDFPALLAYMPDFEGSGLTKQEIAKAVFIKAIEMEIARKIVMEPGYGQEISRLIKRYASLQG